MMHHLKSHSRTLVSDKSPMKRKEHCQRLVHMITKKGRRRKAVGCELLAPDRHAENETVLTSVISLRLRFSPSEIVVLF